MKKICTKCKKEKNLEEFHKDKAAKDGKRHRCKTCAKKYTGRWREENPEKDKEYKSCWWAANKDKKEQYKKQDYKKHREKRLNKHKEYYKKNQKRITLSKRIWTKENKEKCLEYERKWRKNNRDKLSAKSSRRRASKLNATPVWLTQDQLESMKNMYTLSAKIGDLTGQPMEVDHIVPLQGKNVCGLHVPWNLQVLHRSMNRRKNNKHNSSGNKYALRLGL